VVADDTAIEVLLQRDGAFVSSRRIPFETGAADPELAIADLDGDGRADIAASLFATDSATATTGYAAGTAEVGVAWNEGGEAWTWQSLGQYPEVLANPQTGRPRAGDLDLDLDLDLVAFGNLFRNLSNHRTFAAEASPLIDGPLVDLDCDGDLDLVGEALFYVISVAVNEDAGVLEEQETHYDAGEDADFFDATADGTVDLLVTADNAVLQIYPAVAGARFAVGLVPTGGSEQEEAAVADFDGDGRDDVLIGDNFDGAYVHHGTGDGVGEGELIAFASPGYGLEGVAACDVDGDGDPDAVLMTQDGRIGVAENRAGRVGSEQLRASRQIADLDASLERLVCGDLDGDGDADLAVAGAGDVIFGTQDAGVFTFAPHPGLSVYQAGALEVADLDGDGRIELLVADTIGGRLLIAWGTGEVSDVATGAGIEAVATGDLDADGDLDVVTGDSAESGVSILENVGGRAFTRTTMAEGITAEALAVIDLDGVPPLDVALVEGGPGRAGVVWLALRTAAGTALRPWPSGGTDPRTILALDLDQDCADDLLVINKGSGTLAEFLTSRLR
jgi:hypothetical protein